MKISNSTLVCAVALLSGCGAPMFSPKPLDASAAVSPRFAIRRITAKFWVKPRVATTRQDTPQRLWSR